LLPGGKVAVAKKFSPAWLHKGQPQIRIGFVPAGPGSRFPPDVLGGLLIVIGGAGGGTGVAATETAEGAATVNVALAEALSPFVIVYVYVIVTGFGIASTQKKAMERGVVIHVLLESGGS